MNGQEMNVGPKKRVLVRLLLKIESVCELNSNGPIFISESVSLFFGESHLCNKGVVEH